MVRRASVASGVAQVPRTVVTVPPAVKCLGVLLLIGSVAFLIAPDGCAATTVVKI
jgi:hypothetical protein